MCFFEDSVTLPFDHQRCCGKPESSSEISGRREQDGPEKNNAVIAVDVVSPFKEKKCPHFLRTFVKRMQSHISHILWGNTKKSWRSGSMFHKYIGLSGHKNPKSISFL